MELEELLERIEPIGFDDYTPKSNFLQTLDKFPEFKETLKDENYLYFVPASICHDSANNFDTEEVPVNPHSDEMMEVPTDAVHPGRAGYEQIADCLYSVICGTKAKWE